MFSLISVGVAVLMELACLHLPAQPTTSLASILQGAVDHKELKHKINEGPAFQRASRSMSQIGG